MPASLSGLAHSAVPSQESQDESQRQEEAERLRVVNAAEELGLHVVYEAARADGRCQFDSVAFLHYLGNGNGASSREDLQEQVLSFKEDRSRLSNDCRRKAGCWLEEQTLNRSRPRPSQLELQEEQNDLRILTASGKPWGSTGTAKACLAAFDLDASLLLWDERKAQMVTILSGCDRQGLLFLPKKKHYVPFVTLPSQESHDDTDEHKPEEEEEGNTDEQETALQSSAGGGAQPTQPQAQSRKRPCPHSDQDEQPQTKKSKTNSRHKPNTRVNQKQKSMSGRSTRSTRRN